MKRRVVCVFSLILFLLIFCSLLAPSVEREMRTMVEVKHIRQEQKMYNNLVPPLSVQWADGVKIYQVVEGKGWNTGDRIEEVPQHAYYIVYNRLPIDGYEPEVLRAEIYPGKDFDIVLSASREPTVGDSIVMIKEFREREDIYILCYPGGAANDSGYTNFYTRTAQSGTAQLLIPQKAEEPYVEQRVLYSFRAMEAQSLRVYSVADIRQFYEMLPLVFLLLMCLVMGLSLWGYSCILAKREMGRGRILRNAVFCVGLLGAVPLIASQINLPASLLPKENILDFAYYRKEFRQIFGALESMGSDLLRPEHNRCGWICAGILAAAVLLMAVLVFIDCRKKAK